MRIYPILLSGLLAIVPGARGAEAVTSVEQLDISRYAGQWYEIAHLPVSFQKKCKSDIIAHYTLRGDKLIGVLNACTTQDGERAEVQGIARPVPGHPGRLQVRFAPDWLAWVPFVWADYWVLALDPDYQWAVVGEPDRRYLWILSRSPRMSHAQFEQLKGEAVGMGYDLSNLVVASPLD